MITRAEIRRAAGAVLHLVLAVALVALCQGMLLAQPKPGEEDKPLRGKAMSFEERFKQMDKNADGKLTAEELPNPNMLKKLDTNGDGVVTLEEAKAVMEHGGARPDNPAAALEQQFKLMDKNADGKLTAAEFPNAEKFKALDKNADGAVTLDEMRAAREANWANKGGEGAGGPLVSLVKLLDANGDGKLSAQEWASADAFKKLDANGDGAITMEELRGNLAPKAVDGPKPPQPAEAKSFEERFKQADKNGDGKLSPDEYPNPHGFKRMDTNGDGAITLEEAQAAKAADHKPATAEGGRKDK